MLAELIPEESIIHIGGREYRVRYSLNAFLCLETMYKPLEEILQTDYDLWDDETVLQLCHAAMCDMPWNRRAVNRRQWNKVRPDLFELGKMIRPEDFKALRMELADAVIASLPDSEGTSKENTAAADAGHLRALMVDVIGLSQQEFLESSFKELHQRADKYLEVKGMKEMPVEIQMTDKDD